MLTFPAITPPPDANLLASHSILLVEDDEAIASLLKRVLEHEGYAVQSCGAAADAIAAAGSSRPDLVLLDLGLPDADGLDVCRTLRAMDPALAILILTARVTEIDVVLGLDAGADDYLTKPFRLSELLARLRARLRTRGERSPVSVGSAVEVDRSSRRAWVRGVELVLRPTEFDLLAVLASDICNVVSRERIVAEVWGASWRGSPKTLDTHVCLLRRKLEDAGAPGVITTLRGVGYRLDLS